MSTQRLIRFAALLVLIAVPAQAADFSNWIAIVAAGDYRAHSGKAAADGAPEMVPSEVFDNARREIAADFVRLGIPADNIRQFSVRPELYPNEKVLATGTEKLESELAALSSKATGGCLVYVTSHGTPGGAVFSNGFLAPATLKKMLDDHCSKRPTVAVISACYSGVYVLDFIRSDNVLIFTAARRDRTSFGCAEGLKYTFFDECFLQSLPASGDFQKLGDMTRACVAAREQKEGMSPPSEPQFNVGYGLMPKLPTWTTWTPVVEAPKPAGKRAN